jgi:hypothetical protein
MSGHILLYAFFTLASRNNIRLFFDKVTEASYLAIK